ncbi:hypothetical protein ACJX0J_017917, partial [Zea mays]
RLRWAESLCPGFKNIEIIKKSTIETTTQENKEPIHTYTCLRTIKAILCLSHLFHPVIGARFNLQCGAYGPLIYTVPRAIDQKFNHLLVTLGLGNKHYMLLIVVT